MRSYKIDVNLYFQILTTNGSLAFTEVKLEDVDPSVVTSESKIQKLIDAVKEEGIGGFPTNAGYSYREATQQEYLDNVQEEQDNEN